MLKCVTGDWPERDKEDMEWTEPQYSKADVNWAGKYLASDSPMDIKDFDAAINIVDNFRAAHAFPLNTLQHRLRVFASSVDRNAIVAQRLKRLASIITKLQRFPRMQLWDMQDIGGCRAVVASISDVYKIDELFQKSDIKHKLAHQDDYIKEPRDSGYRSRHLIYRYFSDKSDKYNSMKIEVQIRTPIEHAWATAVETVDLFTRQALKSSAGSPQWERFFQLMATEMALKEGTSPVPNTPTNVDELKQQLKVCSDELDVVSTLRGFTRALRVTRRESSKDRDAAFYLLSLDKSTERLRVIGYRRGESKKATEAYAEQEKHIGARGKPTDAVLVAVDSMRNLERAYPNYFADTKRFVSELTRAIQ